MKYIEVLICAALTSFLIGLFYQTEYVNNDIQRVQLPDSITNDIPVVQDQPAKVTVTDHALKPCSQSNTMPCDESPIDPLKERLNAVKNQGGLFYKGERVTCIYQGVYSWDNGDEFIKATPVRCKVIEATGELVDLQPGYQHIHVDCTEGLKSLWGSPGVGLVKGHKLNYKQLWYSSDNCYHF